MESDDDQKKVSKDGTMEINEDKPQDTLSIGNTKDSDRVCRCAS